MALAILPLAGCRSDVARYEAQAAQYRADGQIGAAQAAASAQIGVAQANAAGLAAQAAAQTEQNRFDALAAQSNASAAIANSNAAIAQSENGYKIVKVQEETERASDFNQYLPIILIVGAIVAGGGGWMFFDHRRKMKLMDIQKEVLLGRPEPPQPIAPPERQIPVGVVRFALSVGASDIQEAQDGSRDWFVYEPNGRRTRLGAQPKLLTVSRQ